MRYSLASQARTVDSVFFTIRSILMIKQLYTVALASLFLSAVPTAAQTLDEAPEFTAPDEAWRTVDPDNLMLIDTAYGQIGVELYPDVAPKHTEQVRTLVKDKFYDGIVFHRVISGFMNQTGDPTGTGTGDSHLPNIPAEFTFLRDAEKFAVTTLEKRTVNPANPDLGRKWAGFYNGLAILTQPDAQVAWLKEKTIEATGVHCRGVTSMARANDPNSANSQFFLMRNPSGSSSESLNGLYSVWGKTVMGLNVIDRIKVGVNGETPNFVPDKMLKVVMASDLPEDSRPVVKVLHTNGPDFDRFLATQKDASGAYPDICDIQIPIQIEKK